MSWIHLNKSLNKCQHTNAELQTYVISANITHCMSALNDRQLNVDVFIFYTSSSLEYQPEWSWLTSSDTSVDSQLHKITSDLAPLQMSVLEHTPRPQQLLQLLTSTPSGPFEWSNNSIQYWYLEDVISLKCLNLLLQWPIYTIVISFCVGNNGSLGRSEVLFRCGRKYFNEVLDYARMSLGLDDSHNG